MLYVNTKHFQNFWWHNIHLEVGRMSDEFKVWVQMSKFDKIAIFSLVSSSQNGPWDPNLLKIWAKFGTIGSIRSKCKKSRSFMVLEARFPNKK